MHLKDFIINATSRSVDGIFRTARAMPEDKIEWKPMDQGRTVLDQLQEVAQAANFFSAVLEKKGDPQFSDEYWEQAREERKNWDTLDQCEEICKANTEKLFDHIRSLSDEDIDTTLKFEGSDREYSLADIMNFHLTHLNYHHGQINYMQTLYGDSENH